MAERARRITHGRLSKQEPRIPSAPHVCSVPFTEGKKKLTILKMKRNKQEQNESVFKKAAIEQPRGGCGEITPTAAGRTM